MRAGLYPEQALLCMLMLIAAAAPPRPRMLSNAPSLYPSPTPGRV